MVVIIAVGNVRVENTVLRQTTTNFKFYHLITFKQLQGLLDFFTFNFQRCPYDLDVDINAIKIKEK